MKHLKNGKIFLTKLLLSSDPKVHWASRSFYPFFPDIDACSRTYTWYGQMGIEHSWFFKMGAVQYVNDEWAGL